MAFDGTSLLVTVLSSATSFAECERDLYVGLSGIGEDMVLFRLGRRYRASNCSSIAVALLSRAKEGRMTFDTSSRKREGLSSSSQLAREKETGTGPVSAVYIYVQRLYGEH
jgi:hypothetical protein